MRTHHIFLAMTVGLLAGSSHRTAEDDPYSIGASLYGRAGCPVIVLGLTDRSPAARAGVQPGDELLAVGGTPVNDAKKASTLLRSGGARRIRLTVKRSETEYEIFVTREKQSVIYHRAGKKIISGVIVPIDTTQAEVDRMLSFDDHRFVGKVFTASHYPANLGLFYAGFELFMLRDPAQLTVGGIEEGPATKAGVHYGDIVTSVNGISVAGKTTEELESMLSSHAPMNMHLQVERLGSIKLFHFLLEKAEGIARHNGKRFINGQIVPSAVSPKDLHCFLTE